ncbi:MAG TPA: translation initiation factor IF-3 [Clostridiales bacterium]|nr:translation initiation factor IF-3 [Clostridiales bacterium]
MKDQKDQVQINEDIRDREVRLIGSDGSQLGIVSSREALRLADEQGLDLVKIAPQATPPVCKIMDYGKYRFETLKKQKEARKNQKTVELKEIWLSMTIDIGDLNVKARQAQKFLQSGNKVKVSIRMRGRQNAHAALGEDVMKKFIEIVGAVAQVEQRPRIEGRSILMILAPAKSN